MGLTVLWGLSTEPGPSGKLRDRETRIPSLGSKSALLKVCITRRQAALQPTHDHSSFSTPRDRPCPRPLWGDRPCPCPLSFPICQMRGPKAWEQGVSTFLPYELLTAGWSLQGGLPL